MNEKKTGGPAYPVPNYIKQYGTGMTLRDAFAKDAPISWDAANLSWQGIHGKDSPPSISELLALMAELRYIYADCMLKERSK